MSVQPITAPGTGRGGGSQLFWGASATGAVLDLAIDVASPAEYAVELYFTQGPDFGRVAIEIAGTASNVTVDGYSPRAMAPRPTQAGRFALQAGPQRVAFKVVGKNPQSSGYHMGLDQIRLYPVKAIAASASSPPSGGAQGAQGGPPVAAPKAPAGGKSPSGGQPAGGKQEAPKQPGAECDSTCVFEVATVHRRAEDGSCRPWFRFPCSPYKCDAAQGLCRESCGSDADCSQGSACDTTTGLCATASATCLDAYTLKLSNGQSTSCTPFKCKGNACKSVCSDPYDCAPGNTCNLATGLCVPSPKKK